MKNLIIDIGNTRMKAAIFEGEILVMEKAFHDISELREFSKSVEFDHCIISSVISVDLEAALGFPFLLLTKDTELPIENHYATPETLGVDRKAAAVGGRVMLEKGPVLVIDLGSCITYEFLNEKNQYLGGAISPGLNMRFKAMHTQTAKLPLVGLEDSQSIRLIGDSTEMGLRSGVYFGVQFEMEGFMQAYRSQHQDLKVIICGGDSKFFESLTKDHIFVIPNLVLYGLNRILTYNVNKK
ncbi:type III pantothenate kinase [Rhodonellum sp.]|uniref:type III pantothenate kinase n=1 Tax=Rhodonellum sp. TaxID=2231180 RepID=UPI0027186758|nr:type III pantothenate kinase [Rhodonellum sp.]MDO9552744.1 type III pantothenate kinase [Rhodonellum sp.]